MTVRGRFFNRSDYQQYVYYALVDFPGSIQILPPAIIKPVPLWSGKQVISTIILNLVPKVKYVILYNYKNFHVLNILSFRFIL
jgi:DNA-directed RNA polymerase I subunit RPA1